MIPIKLYRAYIRLYFSSLRYPRSKRKNIRIQGRSWLKDQHRNVHLKAIRKINRFAKWQLFKSRFTKLPPF